MSCEWVYQKFDSDLLGSPVAKLIISNESDENLFGDSLDGIIADWIKNNIWLVSCRIPENWITIKELLESIGFRQIETLVRYTNFFEEIPLSSVFIQRVEENDIDSCLEIGRSAFVFDRYHSDPEINNSVADRLKSAWVKNSISEYPKSSYIIKMQDKVRGFILCKMIDDNAIIDLVAVSPDSQGLGYGRSLVSGVLQEFSTRARILTASTQKENVASTSLYTSMGFRPTAEFKTFHWVNMDIR